MKERIKVILQTRTKTPKILYDDGHYLLGLAQHYGAPTRLLDWTRSPEVAAYFAASGALRDRTNPAAKFSIFAMARIYWESRNFVGCEMIQPSMGGNENMAAQRGVFLLHGWDNQNIWSRERERVLLAPPLVTADFSSRLIRFDVSVSGASDVLNELLSRGVEGANTYPGNRGLIEFALDQTWQDQMEFVNDIGD